VERLVSLALRGGGPDNVTVIVADATDEDIVEASPVVGGAAAPALAGGDAGGRGAGADRESTPAARASALTTRPPVPDPEVLPGEEEVERPPRHPVRNTLLLVGLLAVLGGGLWYGWSVTQSGYYVGVTDDGQVAVFRGVPGRVAGLELSSLHTASEYAVEDLRRHAQDRVREGAIRADSAEEAEERMSELLDGELKPLCPLPPSPSPSPSPSPTTTATDRESSPDPESPDADRSPTRSPTPAAPPPRTDPFDCRTEPAG
jgi:protein phosphatase